MVAGAPCMCMATQPAPVSAATSWSEAEMSLISVAPAATAARATAAFVVSIDDIKALVPATFRHRILINYRAEAEGVNVETVINRLLESVKEPRA